MCLRDRPFAILGEAGMTGVFETGNPKHGWDWLVAKTRIGPHGPPAATTQPPTTIRVDVEQIGSCELDVRDGVAYMPAVTVQDIVSKSCLKPQPPKDAGAGAGAEALTHEVRRWCSGDGAWTNWQPCTAAKAADYAKDDSIEVRRLAGGDHA
jgi:hypothetical protein